MIKFLITVTDQKGKKFLGFQDSEKAEDFFYKFKDSDFIEKKVLEVKIVNNENKATKISYLSAEGILCTDSEKGRKYVFE